MLTKKPSWWMIGVGTPLIFIVITIAISTDAQTGKVESSPSSEQTSDSINKIGAYGRYVDENGNIVLPRNFLTDWSHLGSWAVVEDGKVPDIHGVYAPKSEVEYFRANGKFADGAILVKEVRHARGAQHTTGNAFWAEDVKVWFVMVKDDVGRFPGNPNWGEGWGWGLFEGKAPSKQVSTDYKKDCLGCHVPAKETEWSYLYAYPTLGPTVAQYAPKAEKTDKSHLMALAGEKSKTSATGKKLFLYCKSCHTLEPGKHSVGPSLAGVIGRKAGSAPGFAYSTAMLNSEVIWSPKTLDKHLADVKGFIPGNRMGDLYPGGVAKAADRAALIEYLQQENQKLEK